MSGGGGRERDERGRARNARPRDAAGRPVERGRVGVPRVPDDLVLPPEQALAEAQRLLDEGLPFQAHEVLEDVWKAPATPRAERELWRGLAQICVGLTHLQRGNARGAVSLLRRGAENLSSYDGFAPLASAATAMADRVDRGESPPPVLRLTGLTR